MHDNPGDTKTDIQPAGSQRNYILLRPLFLALACFIISSIIVAINFSDFWNGVALVIGGIFFIVGCISTMRGYSSAGKWKPAYVIMLMILAFVLAFGYYLFFCMTLKIP